MTESAVAAFSPVTPLAAFLESAAGPKEHQAQPHALYHGVLTPRQLDAPEREIASLAAAAAAHDLGWMRRIAVRGADRFRWLSGMVTNAVTDLAPNTGAWNLVLNAQGHILGDLQVWRDAEDGLELVMDADQFERLLAHLEHFIIMDDVELAPVNEAAASVNALGLTGPLAGEVLERMGLPALADPMTCTRVEWNGFDLGIVRGYGALAQHYELWSQAAGVRRLWLTLKTAGAAPAGVDSLEAFRIAEGIVAYGVDMAERDLPQETSQMRALSFNKGCYLGQEIVERIRSRGNVHRHLRQLELTGPLPTAGTELWLDEPGTGTAIGHTTSVTRLNLSQGSRTFALGMVRAEAEARNQPLNYLAGAEKGTAHLLSTAPNLNS